MERLELRIKTNTNDSILAIEALQTSLGQLNKQLSSLNSSGLTNYSNSLKYLTGALKEVSSVNSRDFTRISNNIKKLETINETRLTSVSSGVGRIISALSRLKEVPSNMGSVIAISKSISKLGGANTLKASTNIPLLTNALQNMINTLNRAGTVNNSIIRMINSLANLASVGSKVNATYNSLSRASINIDKANRIAANSTNRTTRAMKRQNSTVRGLTGNISKLIGTYYSIKHLGGILTRAVKSSMDYGETLNLFETSFRSIGLSMGKEYERAFIEQAQKFNKKFTEALTLDPDLILNYQARFAQMSQAMGLLPQAATDVSNAFTALGADIASLFNVDLDLAYKKLQSGLAGQVRPLRELGIDITQASLEATALAYGIDTAMANLDQGTKVQLRFLTIMRTMRVAMTDMARTINEPANQLRVLSHQWQYTARAMGSIFVPMVARVLPYINALLIVLRRLFQMLARLAGYEYPDFSDLFIAPSAGSPIDFEDLSDEVGDVSAGVGGIGPGLGSANKEAKKLRGTLAGFDELNILKFQAPTIPSSGGGGGGGSPISGGVSSGGGIPLLNDAIGTEWKQYEDSLNKAFEQMGNDAEEIADKIMKAFEPFIPFFEGLGEVAKGVWDTIYWTWENVISPIVKNIGEFMRDHPVLIRNIGRLAGVLLTIKASSKILGGLFGKMLKVFKAPVGAGMKALAKLRDMFGGKSPIGGTGAGTGAGTGTAAGAGAGTGWFAKLTNTATLKTMSIAMMKAAIALGVVTMTGHEIWKNRPHSDKKLERRERVKSGTDRPTHERSRKTRTSVDKRQSKETLISQHQERHHIHSLEQHGKRYNQLISDESKKRNDRNKKLMKDFGMDTISEYSKIELGINSINKGISSSFNEFQEQERRRNQTHWEQYNYDTRGSLTKNEQESKISLDRTSNVFRSGLGTISNIADNFLNNMPSGVNSNFAKMELGIDTGSKESMGTLQRNTKSGISNFGELMLDLVKTGTTGGINTGDGIRSGTLDGLNKTVGLVNPFRTNMGAQMQSAGRATKERFEQGSKGFTRNLASRLDTSYRNVQQFVRRLYEASLRNWSPNFTSSGSGGGSDIAIGMFASGGFPTMGQLFIAREAGNEMVGKIGNQSAVANNDQITQAISSAVYNAIVSAIPTNADSGSNQPITINIGGERLVDTVIKGINEKSRFNGRTVLEY